MKFRNALICSLLFHALLIALVFMGGLSKMGIQGNGRQGKQAKPRSEQGKGKYPESVEVTILPPPKLNVADSDTETTKDGITYKVHKTITNDCKYFYGGIGVMDGWDDAARQFAIIEVFPGYPAEKAGLRVGDHFSLFLERGTPGTTVTLDITRDGQLSLVTIVRDKVCTTDPKEAKQP